jgi:predicted RNA methylase
LKLKESYFVDFGSGAGRVLEFFIDKKIKYAKGIEKSEKLTELARLNLSKYDNFQLFHMDAQNYKIDEKDNIFFLYDPFGVETMKEIIKNINYSLEISPRKINIIYISPRYQEIFKTEFKTIYEDVNKFNLGVVIFSN